MTKAEEIAALFDIDVENSLEDTSDYDTKAEDAKTPGSFEDVAKNVAVVMEKEEEEEKKEIEDSEIENEEESEKTEDDLIKDAVEEAGGKVLPKSPASSPSEKPKTVEKTSQKVLPVDNPLGLTGDDLKAYQIILTKYPQFSLYNGDGLFKKFYVYKLKMLRILFSRFPVLDLQSRRKEIMETKVDHYAGKGTLHPDQFREKLDDCLRSRIRIGTLLSEAYDQASSWDRHLELLQGKLYKDHELRGAHKREGLNAEHMQDVEDYVANLQGFIKRAKHVDDLLNSAHESLSRQLACVQMRQPSAGKTVPDTERVFEVIKDMKNQDPALGDLDAIDEGEIIGAPGPSDSVTSVVDMGKFDPDDDMMNVGVKK